MSHFSPHCQSVHGTQFLTFTLSTLMCTPSLPCIATPSLYPHRHSFTLYSFVLHTTLMFTLLPNRSFTIHTPHHLYTVPRIYCAAPHARTLSHHHHHLIYICIYFTLVFRVRLGCGEGIFGGGGWRPAVLVAVVV